MHPYQFFLFFYDIATFQIYIESRPAYIKAKARQTDRKCSFKNLTKRHINLFFDRGELIVSWADKQFQTA